MTVEDNNSVLSIGGDFLADQDNGDDLLIDIDDSGQINIVGDADFFQDGGDDMELNLNQNSGTTAQFNLTGDMVWDHDGGDDMRILIDDASSLLNIDGNLSVNLNDGNLDDFSFNIDNGELDLEGDLNLTRANSTAFIDFDMDGGDVNCNGAVIIMSSGPLGTEGAVRFRVDSDSEFNCSSFSSNFSGSDDLYIRVNVDAGADGEFNVTNDMTLVRTGGDDIEIRADDDNSEINIGGNFSLNSSGTGSEEFWVECDNDGTIDISGDFTVLITEGEDASGNRHEIELQGGGDDPFFHVGGNFSWTSSINLVDQDIDINGGTFDVDGNFSLIQNAGADDFDVEVDGDAVVTIGGDMSMTLNGGDDMSLSLGLNGASTATWTVDGDCSLTHNVSTAGSTFEHFIFESTSLNVGGELNLTTNFTSSPLFRQDIQNSAEVIVDGDVNLSAVGSGDLEIRLQNTSFFRIGGDFVRAASPNAFGELDCTTGTPTVEYKGNAAQIIAEDLGSGGDSFYYFNLEIDNSFGTTPQLTLEGLATVHGDLTMNDGIVASDVTDILVVDDEGTTSNASDDSYVDGYMRKTGNNPFTFPTGDGGFYGPIGMTAPTANTDQFEAEYFLIMPHLDGYDSSLHDLSVLYISKVEYWKLNRTSGSSNPTISLFWDTPRSGGVGDENALRFMRWDGTTWKDLGATNVLGSTPTGSLDNNVAITAFSDGNPYTFGTTNTANPLPIELVDFRAKLNIKQVDIFWTTKSEKDNDYFEIQRSQDGMNWEILSKVNGAGNSTVVLNYSSIDSKPYYGVSYYRLKNVDFDGAFQYSNIVSIENDVPFSIFPNPANAEITISSILEQSRIEIYNSIGQLTWTSLGSEGNSIELRTSKFANGIYFVNYSYNGFQVSEKLIIQH